jgi:hypothetical protein
MNPKQPNREDVKAWVETLYRREPQHDRRTWGEAYDGLHAALLHARKLRRYCTIPAALLAAVFVVLLHGRVWDFEDIRNLFAVELIVLTGLHFFLTKIFVVLAYEDGVQTLLRYYGAHDVPYEEEAIQ